MNPDDFEQQLQRQPLRQPPAQWRREILHVAQNASASQLHARRSLGEGGSTLNSQLAWLRPFRAHLAGLATVWLLILGFRICTPEEPASITANSDTYSPEAIAAWQEQNRQMAQLMGASEIPTPTPEEPKRRPRSERKLPVSIG